MRVTAKNKEGEVNDCRILCTVYRVKLPVFLRLDGLADPQGHCMVVYMDLIASIVCCDTLPNQQNFSSLH